MNITDVKGATEWPHVAGSVHAQASDVGPTLRLGRSRPGYDKYGTETQIASQRQLNRFDWKLSRTIRESLLIGGRRRRGTDPHVQFKRLIH